MTERIENINILLTERTMPSKGQTSSNAINDTIKELSHDLVGIQDQWNNRLVPLVSTLPIGSPSSEVDAFTNGLDGVNLYVVADATSTYRASYYALGAARPNTIYEQFESIYTTLTSLEESTENQLNGLARTAAQVSITDTANIYTASNVETALAEVMVKVNSISLTTLGAATQNILPRTDITYDIGSAVKRWRAGYFGPTSLHVVATAGEAGGVAKDYKLGVDSAGGALCLYDSSTKIAQFHNGIPSTLVPTGTTQAVDWNGGSVQVISLESATGNVTLTFSNPIIGTMYVLKTIQDSAVPRNIVWPAAVKWPDGITPVISTGAAAVDVITLLYDGTNYFSNIGQNYN